MKYTSIDRLEDFEFHDSEIKLLEWSKVGNMEKLSLSAKMLNVHKDAAPNNEGVDMEIKEAVISFFDITILEYELTASEIIDEKGNRRQYRPAVIYKDKSAREMFDKELEKPFTVLHLVKNDNGEYELGAMGSDFFIVRFCFGTVRISWDDYSKAAWYEIKQWRTAKVTLSSPDGDAICDARIFFFDEEACSDQSKVAVTLTYDGTQYQGYGRDYFWVESFGHQKKKLPDGVRLKCCLNCRHGNMCPYGNPPGEVFCTKGTTISSKDDMISYIDNNPEWHEQNRFYTDVCDDFEEQTDDYYTYNDYLCWLNKE